jgi:hypothetical protein
VLWLSVLVVLAAVPRLVSLGRVGFNSDEAVYAGQGAALLGDDRMAEFFSIFRAHPLLLQGMIGSLFTITGVDDVAARMLVALVFGVGTVLVTYYLGREVAGPAVGAVAAVLLAVMPYHVVVSRQVMLDPPLAFFASLSLLLAIRGSRAGNDRLVIPTVTAAALATLSKETGLLLFPILFGVAIGTGWWRVVRLRTLIVALSIAVLVGSPFLLSRAIWSAGGSSDYILWQFLRPPNHTQAYFPGIMIQYAGPLFIGATLIGLGRMLRRRSTADWYLLAFLGVYLTFMVAWPTKLFPYLMLVVPGLAIAAGLGVVWIGDRVSRLTPRLVPPLARTTFGISAVGVLVSAPMVMNTARVIEEGPDPLSDRRFDLEVHEFVGAREAAEWAGEHTPPNARFLTIGPSLGNVLAFYGSRHFVALSVSPDPARRNPAYVPVANPDLAIRQNDIHYAVWDFLSANRSSFYSRRLQSYAAKYGTAVAFAVYRDTDGDVRTIEGFPPGNAEPLIVVFELHGGDPIQQLSFPLLEAQADERTAEGTG